MMFRLLPHMLKDRGILGFAFYDFANSAYVLIIHAFLLPIVFQQVVFSNVQNADFLWGLALALSVLTALILGPILGHRADVGNRKKLLALTVALTFVGLLLLSTNILKLHSSFFFVAFVAVNAAFVLSQIVYDSFLPLVSEAGKASTVSGLSWGFGYVGGVLCLIILQVIGVTELQSASFGIAITAFYFLVFSVISLRLLPRSIGVAPVASIRTAVKELRLKRLLVPLLGIWLINEAIDIFIFFGPLFARSNFGLTVSTIGVYLVIIQLVGFPATWLFGWLGDRFGTIKMIVITIVIWVAVAIGASMAQFTWQLFLVAILGALVIGSTQALLRAYYSNLFRHQSQHTGLAYGFYSLAARSAAVIGPLSYGVLSLATGSQRIAMATTIVPFVVGLGLILWNRPIGEVSPLRVYRD